MNRPQNYGTQARHIRSYAT